MGRELGAFGEEGDVHVADSVAALLGLVDRAAQDFLGIHAEAVRVGVGEEVADVGQAERAEDGVGERVGQGVGVGMAVEAEVGGDFDAAEDQLAAGDEAVDVVTEADADGSGHFFDRIYRINKIKAQCMVINLVNSVEKASRPGGDFFRLGGFLREGGLDEARAELPERAGDGAGFADDFVEAVDKARDFLVADDERRQRLDHVQPVRGDVGEDAVLLHERGDDHLRVEAVVHGVERLPGDFRT